MMFVVIFLSILPRVLCIFKKETIPLHKLCVLDSFGTECILQSLITTSLVPGDKLGISNINLDAIDSSNLVIPLSYSFIDSYFFITFECDIAYSNSWFIYNTDFFEELVLKSPSSYFVLISSSLNCSNYNHTSIGIRMNLEHLDKEILQKIYVLKDPLLLSVDLSTSSSVNEDDSSGLIYEWLRSWSTLWRPTLEILSISSNFDQYLDSDGSTKSRKQNHLLDYEFNLYQYLDASGTSGWGNNNILQTNTSCGHFNKGICGILKYVGDACSSMNNHFFESPSYTSLASINNSSYYIALAIRGTCTFTMKARNAQNAGFIGLIIFDNDQGRIIMGGNDGGDINIPVFMIDYEPGWNLVSALNTKNASISINIRMFNRQAPMAVASLDRLGRVSEIGSLWSNISDAIISQAIYQNYYYELQLQRMALENTTSVVSITDNFYWWSWDIIQIPMYLHYATFSKLHLYFDAKCIRGWDNSCPEWDKLLSLYICLANTTDHSYPCISRQIEIVRSITSYSRGYAGLIDISHLLFFFSEVRSQSGSLHGIKIWGGRNYYMTLTLYFEIASSDSDGGGSGSSGNVSSPLFAYQLWSGNDGLGSDYNSRQILYNLSIPSYSKGVAVTGYITGHGWGAELENCAEFCNHSHHFLLQPHSQDNSAIADQGAQGSQVSIDFWMAGSSRGCVAQVKDGVTPNQYGTWYLGRGGWCPGHVVPLLSWDFSLAACSNKSDSISTKYGIGCQKGRDLAWFGAGNITVKYWVYVNGKVYIPQPSGLNMGFGALIFRSLWFVIYAQPPNSPPSCTVKNQIGSSVSIICIFTYQSTKSDSSLLSSASTVSASASASATTTTTTTTTTSTNPPIDWIQIQVFRSENSSISTNSSEKNYTHMGYIRNHWNRKEKVIVISDVIDLHQKQYEHILYVYAINGVGRSSPCILYLAADISVNKKVTNANKIQEAFIFAVEICLPIFFVVFILLLCITARVKKRSFRDVLFQRSEKHRALGQQLDGEDDNNTSPLGDVEMIRR